MRGAETEGEVEGRGRGVGVGAVREDEDEDEDEDEKKELQDGEEPRMKEHKDEASVPACRHNSSILLQSTLQSLSY